MIDTRAFVVEALQPWNSARCNCVSAVAAALAGAPRCSDAFAAWLAQPEAERRAQARSADLVGAVVPFAEAAGLEPSAEPDGWGVVQLEGRQAVALKHGGKWLLRVFPTGVVVLSNPHVLRQWGIA